MEPAPATIHRIIAAFSAATETLGARMAPLDIERASVLVHEAMAGRARLFHGPEHIFDVAAGAGADAVETLAILFHDVVYVQVDGALPPRVSELLGGAVDSEAGTYRVGAIDAASDGTAYLVMQLFGLSPGQVLSPFAGLNEFLSALVAARALAPALGRPVVAAIAACIEGTIPFRGPDAAGRDPFDRLAERLARLDGVALDGAAVAAAVRRAIRVANSDVGNFADPDVARFLDNTWQLLPEANPALLMPTAYTVRQYRTALGKMAGFLATLGADRVFHCWGGEPDQATFRGLVARAAGNLQMAVRYLGVKLYAAALLEALALCTGGDCPIELLAGAIPRPGAPVKRIDQFLPAAPVMPAPPASGGSGTDPALLALFVDGRAAESSFDLRTSPLSAFVYRYLGEDGLPAATAAARDFAAGRDAAGDFLRRQPAPLVAALARAAARVAVTRADALEALAAAVTAPRPPP
jgi:hypothetical protein